MTKLQDLNVARNEGSLAAFRELARLKVDQNRPIDIFQIIKDAGLWLFFQPMDNLLGAYLPGGILITNKRPQSVQRLTAAHEYGHHVLKHKTSLDDAGDIEQMPDVDRELGEVAAQAFAVDFLMPLQLVNKLWADLGLPQDARNVEARQIYLLSLLLGASYTATIYQLVDSKKITRSKGNELRQYSPKQIKQSIAGTKNSYDPKADVWPLQEADSGRALQLRVNDVLRIRLPETPSTGYLWTVEEPRGHGDEIIPGVGERQDPLLARSSVAGDENMIREHALEKEIDDNTNNVTLLPYNGVAWVTNEFEGIEPQLFQETTGMTGSRLMSFRAIQAGQYTLKLSQRRPWQKNGRPSRSFEINLSIDPKPTGEADRGPHETLKSHLAMPALS